MPRVVLIAALDKGDPTNMVEIGLGPLAIEAYLSSKGIKDVYVVDDAREIAMLKPDIVGISSVTENYGIAIEIAEGVKKDLGVPVIVGGVHISTCPESLHEVFDAGIIGEGEETFLELVNSSSGWDDIRGIVIRKGNKIKINPPRPAISNLNRLPIPNRKKWIDKIGMPYIMTTRGCPYHCSFCSSPIHWGSCRMFSPQYVISELKDIIKGFEPRHIVFFDDIFTLNKKRLKEIVDLIVAEGLDKAVTFSCFSRVGMIDKEVIKLLKKGNIRFISVGAESASEKMIDRLKDKGHKVSQLRRAMDEINNNSLSVGLSFIIGSPGETERDLAKTVEFIEMNMNRISEIEITPFVPVPGTVFWNGAKKKGFVKNDMDWSRLKHYSFLHLFNKDRYIYVNEKMPYERFLCYVERLIGLYKQIMLSEKKLKSVSAFVNPTDMPARLKRVNQKG